MAVLSLRGISRSKVVQSASHAHVHICRGRERATMLENSTPVERVESWVLVSHDLDCLLVADGVIHDVEDLVAVEIAP